MNDTDKLYIAKSLINQDILASEITSEMNIKLMNEIPFNRLEERLLILVIENDINLIPDYKNMLIDIILEKRND